MDIKQSQDEVFICQKKYAKEILKKFHMEGCKSMNTPMNQKEKFCKEDGTQKVDEAYFRSLMYLTATRLHILIDVSILSRLMHCASEMHLKAAKRVIRYTKGTINFGIRFTKIKEFGLFGCSDSDWAGSVDDMKSTSGYYCFSFGSGVFFMEFKETRNSRSIYCRSRIYRCNCGCKSSFVVEETQILLDNQATIAISHNPVFRGKTKHFNINLFLLREVQKDGLITLMYCKTDDQVADVFTKPLPVDKFETFIMKLGVSSI